MRGPATGEGDDVGRGLCTSRSAYSHTSCASVSVLKDVIPSRYCSRTGSCCSLFEATKSMICRSSSVVCCEFHCWNSGRELSDGSETLSHSSGTSMSSMSTSVGRSLYLSLSSSYSASGLSSYCRGAYWLEDVLLVSDGGALGAGDDVASATFFQSVPSSYGSSSVSSALLASFWLLWWLSWFGRFLGGGAPGDVDRALVSRVLLFSSSSTVVGCAFLTILRVRSRRRDVWLAWIGWWSLEVLLRGGGAAAVTEAMVCRSKFRGNPGYWRMVVVLRWRVSGVRRR